MRGLLAMVSPNVSTDIISVNRPGFVTYSAWLSNVHAQEAQKSGPVSVRVDKAECERLISNMRGIKKHE